MKLNRSVSYYLDKAGEFMNKSIQHSLKGNYDRAGYYMTLSHQYNDKAKRKEREKLNDTKKT